MMVVGCDGSDPPPNEELHPASSESPRAAALPTRNLVQRCDLMVMPFLMWLVRFQRAHGGTVALTGS